MGRRLRQGEEVRIAKGSTKNHDMVPIECSGMTGVICDDAPLESTASGNMLLGVKLDPEHGGGHAYVPAHYLKQGRSTSVGAMLSEAARATWDRVFGGGNK